VNYTDTKEGSGLILRTWKDNGPVQHVCPECKAFASVGAAVRHGKRCDFRAAQAPVATSQTAYRTAAQVAASEGIGSDAHRAALDVERAVYGVSYAMNRDTD
jgi:hypothetical protein